MNNPACQTETCRSNAINHTMKAHSSRKKFKCTPPKNSWQRGNLFQEKKHASGEYTEPHTWSFSTTERSLSGMKKKRNILMPANKCSKRSTQSNGWGVHREHYSIDEKKFRPFQFRNIQIIILSKDENWKIPVWKDISVVSIFILIKMIIRFPRLIMNEASGDFTNGLIFPEKVEWPDSWWKVSHHNSYLLIWPLCWLTATGHYKSADWLRIKNLQQAWGLSTWLQFDKHFSRRPWIYRTNHITGINFFQTDLRYFHSGSFSPMKMGMNYFDLELFGEQFIIHNCFPSSQKKSLLKDLESDFRLLLPEKLSSRKYNHT